MVNIGIIGYNEGNGHPYSFSAIMNGFDSEAFTKTNWDVIHNYLKLRDKSEFGIADLKVTHVWMPEAEMTENLAAACYVDNVCADPHNMIGHVDAVIIARDDAETHFPLAKPFLEANIPVLIDKPLTLAQSELDYFMPYVKQGTLMSSAAFRYAIELEPIRQGFPYFGQLQFVHLIAPLDWERYGVHMLDAYFSFSKARPVKVHHIPSNHDAFVIELDDGSMANIHCQGTGIPIGFEVSIFGQNANGRYRIQDNFSAFKGLLNDFSKMISSGKPPIAPSDVRRSISTILAGVESRKTGKPVVVNA